MPALSLPFGIAGIFSAASGFSVEIAWVRGFAIFAPLAVVVVGGLSLVRTPRDEGAVLIYDGALADGGCSAE